MSSLGAIVVREGTREDLPDIMPIMAAAFHPDFGEAWSEAQCIGAMALPGCWMILAEQEGQCAGFAIIRSVLEEAELLLIAVHPALQHQSIGQILFRAVDSKCRAVGVMTIHVEMRADNPAMSFYTALGFQIVGERRNYYRRKDGKTASALTLCRILPKNSVYSG